MNPLTAHAGLAQIIGALAIAVAIWFHGFSKGNDSGEVEVAMLKAKHADLLQGIAEKTSAAYALAIRREREITATLHDIDIRYQEELANVESNTRDSVLADLRAGRLKLRHPPTRCPVPAAAQAAATAGRGDGEAADGGEAARVAAEAIGIGAEADAKLEACQSVIAAYITAADTGSAKP